MVTEVKVKG